MLKKYLKKVALWMACTAFVNLAFFISLLFVFPYNMLSERLVAQAKQADILLSIGSLGPSFLGIKAKNIHLSPASPAAPHNNPSPDVGVGTLRLDALSVRLNPFLWRLSTNLQLAHGNVHLSNGIFNPSSFSAQAQGIDFSQINFPALLWMLSPQTYNSGIASPKLDMEGVLSHAQLSFHVPKNQGAAEAQGNWNLEIDNLTIKQGTVAIPFPGAKELTPVDLPRIVLGNFKSAATIKKGHLQIVQTKIQGNELNCELFGNLQLARQLASSEANFMLRLRVEPELLARLSIFGSAISLLPVDTQDEQWRKAQFTGPLSRLKMK